MPLAQFFFDKTANDKVSRRMPAPKKATQDAWIREARKTIPTIPRKDSDWRVTKFDATIVSIYVVFTNSIGELAYLTIDRTVPSIG